MGVLKVNDGTAWRKVGCEGTPTAGRFKLTDGTRWVVEPCPEDAGTMFADDFNRSNGAVANGWTVLRGGMNVSSNQLVNASPGSEAIIVRNLGSNDFDIQADFLAREPSSAILFRVQDADNYLMWVLGTSSSSFVACIGGSFFVLATRSVGTTHRVVGEGNLFRFWIDGVYVGATETSTFPTGGQVGLRALQSPIIDNFTAGSYRSRRRRPLKALVSGTWTKVACMVPAGIPTATKPFSDTFTRADGTPGDPWYTPLNSSGDRLEIIGGKLVPTGVSGSGYRSAYLKIDDPTFDVSCQFRIGTTSPGNFNLRVFDVDPLSDEEVGRYYECGANVVTSEFSVSYRTAFAFVTGSGVVPNNSTHTLRVQSDGVKIAFDLDGTRRYTETLRFSPPAWQRVLRFDHMDPTGWIDNVTVDDCAGPL